LEEAKGMTFEIGGPDVIEMKPLMEIFLEIMHRKKIQLELPIPALKLLGRILEKSRRPLLTEDEVNAMQADAVVSGENPGIFDLGVEKVYSVDEIALATLRKYRTSLFYYELFEAEHHTHNVSRDDSQANKPTIRQP